MKRTSVAEQNFKAKYPSAELRTSERDSILVAVYVGDYICAEGITRAQAFAEALDLDSRGLITPDPNE